ncbi:MAG TPA: c-type cytochrome [Anaerolineae bacterium]
MRRLLFTGGCLLAAFLLFCLLAIAPGNTVAQEPVVPQTPPDAERGLEIFAERCANCHGAQGGGDGQLAANLPNPPTAFNDRDYRQTAVPALLFDAITNGRIDRGMPPFGPQSSNPLSEAERWDLVAAIYSLSTPADSIDSGQALYEEHVATAAASLDLADPVYWFSRSNVAVLQELESAGVLAAGSGLSQAEQQAIVDYARTFSYNYVDPSAPVEPIETATIGGQVVNGTSGEAVEGVTATLRGFTRELEQTVTMTATVGTDGRYTFELSQIPPNLVYIVGVDYNGIRFSSDVDQLNRSDPSLELPVTVYETTTDPGAVRVEQLHVVLDFAGDQLQVSELYVFSNDESAVFVGETGNQEEGTVAIVLPAGAENPVFQRSFDSLERFAPASEVIQTETGWADTLPLRPGRGTLALLVQYDLPYENGMRLAHPLPYKVESASVILPDTGVTLTEGEWTPQGTQTLPSGAYLSYGRTGLQPGDAITLTLNGRPQRVVDTQGNALLLRDETTELVIGGSALLLVVVVAAYTVRAWQTQSATPAVATGDIDALLQAIADLDDAYEDGDITDDAYIARRQELKSDLIAIWHEE